MRQLGEELLVPPLADSRTSQFDLLVEQSCEHHVNVDTPDIAATEDEPAAPKEKPLAAVPSTKTREANTAGVSPRL